MDVTFEFTDSEYIITIPARFERNPVFHAVQLLRGADQDPHEAKRCWLEGERRCRSIGSPDWVTKEDVTKYLRNGLRDEKTGEQTYASPLVLPKPE